jgi:hypothetical protein
MTILPKNFGGAKKSHRKPNPPLQVDHGTHSKGHSKKPVVERSHQQRHLIPNQQEALNSDDEYESGFKDEEVSQFVFLI